MSKTSAPVWLDPIMMPLAALYGGIVDFRNHSYENNIFKSYHVTVPVISIGGITAGGAGKTPLAIWTLEHLLANGVRCGLLSRGYKRSSSGTVWVSRGDGSPLASADEGGDEPRLIAERLPSVPVVCDSNRVRGANLLIGQADVKAIVLDDGFQHRRLKRNLDWVSLDTALPRRALRMLPWGYLRERFLAVNRANAVWIKVSDTESAEKWMKAIRALDVTVPLIPFRLHEAKWVMNGESLSIESLKRRTGVGFAGIAHPQRFKNSLLNAKIEVMDFIEFNDHHRYTNNDVKHLLDSMKRSGAELLFTTEKDFVKLPEELRTAPIAVLRIEVEPLGDTSEIERQLQTIAR